MDDSTPNGPAASSGATPPPQSGLIANLSHEMRTPLHAIIGMSELLAETPLSTKQTEIVGRIQSSSQNLLALINDILTYSSIESGKLALRSQQFELAGCVDRVINVISDLAFEKNLNLGFYVNPNVPELVSGDEIRLQQILTNLLSNAVKFTDQGEILLTIQKNPDREDVVDIAVHDTGIGIPLERQRELFQPFHQLDGSARRQHQGSGLGLAITNHLVVMMDGKIRLASSLGKGSSFEFSIRLPAAGASPDKAAPFPPLPLLLVEPTPGVRRLTSLLLNDLGLRPHSVGNQGEAYQLLQQDQSFAAVILPANLHDTDSIELAAQIRTDARFQGLKLFLQCPKARDRSARIQMLFDDTFDKPPRRRDLETKLGLHLSRSQTALAKPATPEVRPMRLLLAEDDPVNQRVAKGYLRQLNITPEVAGDGEEVLQRLHGGSYDVVLMDLQMPLRDGLETTREIRRRLPAQRQPWIVAMTANASEEDRQRCLDCGMNDFLSKPLGVDDLRQVLRRAQINRDVPAKTAESAAGEVEVHGKAHSVRDSATQPLPGNLELKRVKDLQKALGDEEVRSLVDLYLRDTHGLFGKLETAIVEKDTAEVHHWAHRIKGASANVGASMVRLHAEQLEAEAKSGQLATASQRVTDMRNAFHGWESAVRNWLG